MPDAAVPAPSLPPARRPFTIYAPAVSVLLVSLLVVAGYWHSVRERGLRQAEAAFHADSERALALLRQRLLGYELLVRGGAALQVAPQESVRAQWLRYVSGLDLPARFPAVQTLGFALEAQPGESGALAATVPGLPTFADLEPARGDARAIVLSTAPESPANDALTGFDLSADLRRREAMELAAGSGAPRMSLPAPALGVANPATATDTVVLFAPVYAADGGPTARETLRGWAFAQLRLDRLVEGVSPGSAPGGTFALVDVTGGRAVPLYRTMGQGNAAEAQAAPAFAHRALLETGGRYWALDFASAPRDALVAQIPGLRATLVIGVLGALLLCAAALAIARIRARVDGRAERMSDSWRRSEQRFRSAMQYSAIGKALLDKGGRIIEANPALAQLLGTTPEALVGSLFGAHFADDESIRTMERNVLAGSAFRTTRRLRRSDGEVRHASLTFASVPGESGDDLASLVQVEDVTERLRAEAQVLSLNRTLEARVALRTRELSHANRELEAFANSVSHDLRAPLRAIDGFGRLLGERYGEAIDENGRDYLARIRGATARMGGLIDALLQLSHVSRGELQREPVDLNRMAHEIANELRAADPARDVLFAISPGLLATGDPVLLRMALHNLMHNAWKFTRGRGGARIEVSAYDGGFQVRDNGIGFPQAQVGKLFHPFQRLHAGPDFAGHGIGLAAVKRIAERHGGQVRADGAEDRGATFWFSVPEPDTDHAAGVGDK